MNALYLGTLLAGVEFRLRPLSPDRDGSIVAVEMIHWLFGSTLRLTGGVWSASVCEDEKGFGMGAGRRDGWIHRDRMRNRPHEQAALSGVAPFRRDYYR